MKSVLRQKWIAVSLILALGVTGLTASVTAAGGQEEGARQEQARQVMSALEDSHWVQDGASDADRVIYTFTDANCPYCERFREAADPWIDAGKVQLRHIMVGIISDDSPAKAAHILAGENPTQLLHRHQSGEQAVELDQTAIREAWEQVQQNNQLMRSLGASATPTSIYLDEEGDLGAVQGLPQGSRMRETMGSSRPQE